MTLIELISRASSGYEKNVPESPLLEQVHDDGIPLTLREYEKKGCDDPLARFIVLELAETYDPDVPDDLQPQHAAVVINNVRRNLENILDAFGDA